MRHARLPAYSPYARRADADARVASALNAMRALLSAEILPTHRRELLSTCIWKLSLAEAPSKYETRYVTPAALLSAKGNRVHEHVHERAKLVDDLIAGTLKPEDLPALAQACVVTASEHATLGEVGRSDPSVSGWARYRAATMAVIDRAMGIWQVGP